MTFSFRRQSFGACGLVRYERRESFSICAFHDLSGSFILGAQTKTVLAMLPLLLSQSAGKHVQWPRLLFSPALQICKAPDFAEGCCQQVILQYPPLLKAPRNTLLPLLQAECRQCFLSGPSTVGQLALRPFQQEHMSGAWLAPSANDSV